MRIFFLIFLLAYVGGNVYIFIRTLQMLSGFSLAMKILLSVVYWLVAFSLVIAMLTRHIDMPVILSKSMFHIGSVWLVFTLYMIFALLIAVTLFIYSVCNQTHRPYLSMMRMSAELQVYSQRIGFGQVVGLMI